MHTVDGESYVWGKCYRKLMSRPYVSYILIGYIDNMFCERYIRVTKGTERSCLSECLSRVSSKESVLF